MKNATRIEILRDALLHYNAATFYRFYLFTISKNYQKSASLL